MDWTDEFWKFLERLVAEKKAVIDRPRGSSHPRYPDIIYPKVLQFHNRNSMRAIYVKREI